MTEENDVREQKDDDEEYAQAYGFWIFVFGVVGAIVGYNLGLEAGFGFWPNVGLAVIGFIVLAVIAYTFRKVIAVVGAIVILITVIMAVIEGMRSA